MLEVDFRRSNGYVAGIDCVGDISTRRHFDLHSGIGDRPFPDTQSPDIDPIQCLLLTVFPKPAIAVANLDLCPGRCSEESRSCGIPVLLERTPFTLSYMLGCYHSGIPPTSR